MEIEALKIGHYTFKSKDTGEIIHMIQCLSSEFVNDGSECKSSCANVKVDPKSYDKLSKLEFGTKLIVRCTINFSTKKPKYEIIF